jgi:probable phosphoglycerate mutase
MGIRLLYLVRHGQYADGGSDVDDGPLTEVGVQQSTLVRERLAGTPFAAIYHSTTERATQCASLISAGLPGVPVHGSDLLRDFLPTGPDPTTMTATHLEFLAAFPAEALAEGPGRAAAAIERFARPADGDGDVRELVVTHNFVIGWFVASAVGARTWLGINQYHCGLTIIGYRPDRPPVLVCHNDVGHLPPPLRGTEFPDALRV